MGHGRLVVPHCRYAAAGRGRSGLATRVPRRAVHLLARGDGGNRPHVSRQHHHRGGPRPSNMCSRWPGGPAATLSARRPRRPLSGACAIARARSIWRVAAEGLLAGTIARLRHRRQRFQDLVLVYNIQAPPEIFDHFVGVEGSAYLVGGLGVNFQTNQKLRLAPIPHRRRSPARRQSRLSQIYRPADLEPVLELHAQAGDNAWRCSLRLATGLARR